MDERLKQRLVGAVVLVALAVIFIPMLLEGPRDMGPSGSNLPPPPPESLDEGSIEPLELPPPILPEDETPAPPEPAPAVETPPPAGGPASAPEPAPAGKAPVPAATPEPAAPPVAAEPSTPPVEPALSGWVVQVGSFGREANALALRDKLRAKGYTAFVEKARTDKGLVFRVRVGPELERENAERLRERLAGDFKLKAIVTRYP